MSFKSVDFFQRLPKNMMEGSSSGMLISIGCTLAIIAVIFTEVTEFFSDRVINVLEIEQLDKRESMININLDISFPHAPCSILSLDVQDLMGTHIVNVKENLRKMRLNSMGEQISVFDPLKN